jgi:hypothetical protein
MQLSSFSTRHELEALQRVEPRCWFGIGSISILKLGNSVKPFPWVRCWLYRLMGGWPASDLAPWELPLSAAKVSDCFIPTTDFQLCRTWGFGWRMSFLQRFSLTPGSAP